MKQRRKILLALTGVLIVGVVLWAIIAPEPEPSYAGKTLSQWLVSDGINPVEEEQAIRHIGTNAIPYLLRWIQYEQPRWKFILYDHYSYVTHKDFPDDKYLRRSWNAAWAFKYLGQEARTAIPELKKLAIDQRPSNFRAMLAMALVGKDGLPPLMEALTNHDANIRCNAIHSIGEMETNALQAIPLLIKLLTDSDPDVAQDSAHFLGELRLDPDRVVPALTNAFLSSDANERAIVGALVMFGTNARPAVPGLLKLLSNSSGSVQETASNALLRIDPEALKRATQP